MKHIVQFTDDELQAAHRGCIAARNQGQMDSPFLLSFIEILEEMYKRKCAHHDDAHKALIVVNDERRALQQQVNDLLESRDE